MTSVVATDRLLVRVGSYVRAKTAGKVLHMTQRCGRRS